MLRILSVKQLEHRSPTWSQLDISLGGVGLILFRACPGRCGCIAHVLHQETQGGADRAGTRLRSPHAIGRRRLGCQATLILTPSHLY